MSAKNPLPEYGPIHRRRAGGEIEFPPAEDTARPPGRQPAPPARAPQPRRHARRHYPILGTLLGMLLGLGLLAGLPYAVDLAYAGRVLPGVSIQGQPAGQLDAAGVQTLLDTRYAAINSRPLVLEFEGRQWQPALADLGMRLDLEATARQALSIGRRGDPLTRLRELLLLWRQGVDLGPGLTVDMPTAQRYILSLASELDITPRNAALGVVEARIITNSARTGRQVLVDQTLAALLTALQDLDPAPVAIQARALTPAIDDTDVALATATAQGILGTPLELRQGERRWTWESQRIAELLAVRAEDGRLVVEVDPQRLTAMVERLAQLVDSGTAEPRVAWQNGQLAISQPGKVGVRLKQGETAALLMAALAGTQRSIELPVEQIEPRVTEASLPNLGVTALLGEGRSSFAGSAAYRITNIKAGATRINGVLIAPGEEFSFNAQLGDVNAENGFVEGYAIIGNRTQLEWGGGVCQNSTTVFRAAFWAGLPITERHAHAFYISWYDRYGLGDRDGQGLDASIYTGVLDLKFANDTAGWLLLEAIVDEAAQTFTVRLYGTPTGRTVALDGPYVTNEVPAPSEPVYVEDSSLPRGTVRQSDTARSGRDITVYRIISDNGVPRAPEAFFTRFRAWPNVYVRGTG